MPVTPGVPGANIPSGDDALIRRIQELERRQNELLPAVMAAVGPAITTLEAQQATLTAAVADLTTAQANITTLISQQLTSGNGSNVYNGSISTATTAYASVSVPVPSGYTHAIVIGISHGLFSGSPLALGIRTRIDGVDGNQASIVTSAAWMSGSCSSTRASYSVSGNVVVSTVCSGAASGVTGTCITSALVLFQR